MRETSIDTGAWPQVSVVIPTHRRPTELPAAVESVVDQDYPGIVECIVVHDGEPADLSRVSTDRRRPVVVIENTRTGGLTGARNSGLAVARGTVIGWCDDDDVWHPDKLRRQIELLRVHREAVAAGSSHQWVTTDGRRSVHRPPAALATRRDLMLHGSAAHGLHSSTVVVLREVYDRIGQYNEALPLSQAEDLEFYLRLTGLGPVPVSPQPLVDIRVDPKSSFAPAKCIALAESAQTILDQHPEFRQLPAAEAFMCRRIASNYSEAGRHRDALRWARRAVRLNPRDQKALLVLACSTVRIRVTHAYRTVRGLRKLFRLDPMNSTLRGRV